MNHVWGNRLVPVQPLFTSGDFIQKPKIFIVILCRASWSSFSTETRNNLILDLLCLQNRAEHNFISIYDKLK